MWQATLGGGGKAYSLDKSSAAYTSSSGGGGTSLPGFYSSGYPPTPPKDTGSPEDGGVRAGGAETDYINSSLSSEPDLMTSDMKPTPESLMGFPSFPYSSRKIQEGVYPVISCGY